MGERLPFETETCGRCGGSGRYSYNQIDRDRCYGCSGTGLRYTKRGGAALQWYREQNQVPLADVGPGDRIEIMGNVFTIAEVECKPDGTRCISGGKEIVLPLWSFKTAKGNEKGFYTAQTHVRLIPTGQQREDRIAAALEYQNSLTKAGKPRKVRKVWGLQP